MREDDFLEMAYEESQAPTLMDDDSYWINVNEANDYLGEFDEDREEYFGAEDGWE